MLSKHKLFLLLAKWIPIVTAIGILATNTLALLNVGDAIIDIFNVSIGISAASIALMYSCSYAFNFCSWHRAVITYNAVIVILTIIIRYTSIECGYSVLLLLYYILARIFILIGIYLHSKRKH